MALSDLPNPKWLATGKQVILKTDFSNLEGAVLQVMGISKVPPEVLWVDAATVKVPVTADSPAELVMSGIQNIFHSGEFLSGGLSDGNYRQNSSNVSCIFGAGGTYGNEKAAQWYAILAIAGNSDTTFTLKAMPYCRFKSQASQVISLGTHVTPATGIGYGFTTDQWVAGAIYVLTGASQGLIRPITANNNDNGTGGTITYGGAALTMSAGDWFMIIPPAGINWRRLADVWNDGSGNINSVDDLLYGRFPYVWTSTTAPDYWTCPLTLGRPLRANGCGGGGGGGGGGSSYGGSAGAPGVVGYGHIIAPTAGTVYQITIGQGGARGVGGANGSDGTATLLGALLSLAGGVGGVVDGNNPYAVGGTAIPNFTGSGTGGNGGYQGQPGIAGNAGCLSID